MVYEVIYHACAFCGTEFKEKDSAIACQSECFKNPETGKHKE